MARAAPAFIHGSVLRERANVLITMLYVALAVVLGFEAEHISIFKDITSPMSSPSAIAILTTVATGMMALTAIVFALAFLSLQVSSTSYSPRLVALLGRRHFMGHMLGVFTGTFIYSLVAIRSIDLGGRVGVNIAVIALALLWLMASIVALVLLLPRMRGVMLVEVLRLLHHRGTEAVKRLYAPAKANASSSSSSPLSCGDRTVSLMSNEVRALPVTGTIRHTSSPMYLCGIDPSVLVRCASEARGVLMMPFAIGDAIIPGDRLIIVLGATHPIDERRVRRALWLGYERELDNDPAYALRLLVDIAIRALSPAINDPSTAVSALDEIDALLRQLGQCEIEAHESVDDHGVVRLIRAVPSWDDFVAIALTEIHQYGRESLQVQRRLAALIHDLSEVGVLPNQRRPALERFEQLRSESTTSFRRAFQSWMGASDYDRQGLGHEQPHGGLY